MVTAVSVGELKSCLQKYVRRDEKEKALSVIDRVWAMGPKEHTSLCKRLPMIVVEDCGWKKGWVIEDAVAQINAPVLESVRRLVLAMCAGAKDKDACGLYDKAVGQGLLPEATEDEMRAALTAGDEMTAARIAIGATKSRPGSSWVWGVLSAHAHDLSVQNAIDSLRRRVAMGTFGCDLGLSAAFAVILTLRMAPGQTFTVPSITGTYTWKKADLDWYAFDMHTQIGKIAMGHITKKTGVSTKTLENLWFNLESARVNALAEQKWFDNWDFCFQRDLGVGLDKAQEMWRPIYPEVKGFVEWLMKQRGVS